MARKEERREGAKSYSYENPATGRDYCGGFYCDYCTPYQNFMAGAEYADKTMLDKACEWLKENIYNRVYKCGDDLGFPTAQFIADFRKAMEE